VPLAFLAQARDAGRECVQLGAHLIIRRCAVTGTLPRQGLGLARPEVRARGVGFLLQAHELARSPRLLAHGGVGRT
jgi:hypothetical protein